MSTTEQALIHLEHDQIQSLIAQQMSNAQKLQAEMAKLIAETAKINREARWYPVIALAAFAASVAAVAKLFFGH